MTSLDIINRRCDSCGCSLEGASSGSSCLPCIISRAIKEMSRFSVSEKESSHKKLKIKPSIELQKTSNDPVKSIKRNKAKKKPAPAKPKKTSIDNLRRARSREGLLNSNNQTITCILCGQEVPSGKLLAHKSEVHGERAYEPSTYRAKKSRSLWTPIVSGGLPSLGKRS